MPPVLPRRFGRSKLAQALVFYHCSDSFRIALETVKKRSHAFFKDCFRQTGGIFFVHYAVQTEEGVAVGAMDFTELTGAPGFSTKCRVRLEESGVHQLWEEYASEMWQDVMESREPLTVKASRARRLLPLETNKWGEPLLPNMDDAEELATLAGGTPDRDFLQSLLRTFLTMHWGLAGPASPKQPTVPWSKIAANPRQFVSEECWPDELLKYLKDPSGVVVEGCMELLLFWRA